jgi:hypothetical protein
MTADAFILLGPLEYGLGHSNLKRWSILFRWNRFRPTISHEPSSRITLTYLLPCDRQLVNPIIFKTDTLEQAYPTFERKILKTLLFDKQHGIFMSKIVSNSRIAARNPQLHSSRYACIHYPWLFCCRVNASHSAFVSNCDRVPADLGKTGTKMGQSSEKLQAI